MIGVRDGSDQDVIYGGEWGKLAKIITVWLEVNTSH